MWLLRIGIELLLIVIINLSKKGELMETLQILELKIAQLIERIKELKVENTALLDKIDVLETSMLRGKECFEEEKALTRTAVDDLIKNIDSLIGNQDQQ